MRRVYFSPGRQRGRASEKSCLHTLAPAEKSPRKIRDSALILISHSQDKTAGLAGLPEIPYTTVAARQRQEVPECIYIYTETAAVYRAVHVAPRSPCHRSTAKIPSTATTRGRRGEERQQVDSDTQARQRDR